MRGLPTLAYNAAVEGLPNVLRELLRVLGTNVLDYSTYSVEKIWSVPFNLMLPGRADSPRVVRLARAQVVGDPVTPVHFGATTWTWSGSTAVISDVDGLAAGVSYKLTFEVVG